MVHYFDEARVQQLLSVPDLLQGVREALIALTLGQVVQPLRMVMPIGKPASGAELAQGLLRGQAQTIDVQALGFERLVQNRPLRELAVIG
jgi:hypothetical protein